MSMSTKEELDALEKLEIQTKQRRMTHLLEVGTEEAVYQILDAIRAIDHSKTVRAVGLAEQADFMIDHARRVLGALLGIDQEIE